MGASRKRKPRAFGGGNGGQATPGSPAIDAIARLVAAEQARHPGRPCMVIAEAAVATALDSLPAGIARVVVDAKAPVAPGTTIVAVAEAGVPASAIAVAGPFSSPEVRRQRLLAAACGLVTRRRTLRNRLSPSFLRLLATARRGSAPRPVRSCGPGSLAIADSPLRYDAWHGRIPCAGLADPRIS